MPGNTSSEVKFFEDAIYDCVGQPVRLVVLDEMGSFLTK